MNNNINHLNAANIPADAFHPFKCVGTIEHVDYGTGEMIYEKCDGEYFEQIYQYRTYQGIISSGKVVIMTIPVVRCLKCGKVSELTYKQS